MNLYIKRGEQKYWTYATNDGQAITIKSDQTANWTIDVFDANGQLIKSSQHQVQANEAFVTEISNHQLPQGIYFYRIREQGYLNEQQYSGKFIF